MHKLNKMVFSLTMDRPVVTKNDTLPFSPHYIVPEGYSIKTKNDDVKTFDFNQTQWSRTENDKTTIMVEVSDFDDEFSAKFVTSEDMSGCTWVMFNIDTGDESDPEIKPVGISYLMLEFVDDTEDNPRKKYYSYCVPKFALDQINEDCISIQR